MKIIICSGYFNPIHSGHIDYLNESKKMGDRLFVIVNNDIQVKLKNSKPFMKEGERLKIVENIKSVDYVRISSSQTKDVCEDLYAIKDIFKDEDFFDLFFSNGGDRNAFNTPESNACDRLGIEMIFGVGGEKIQSSSNLLNN